MKTHGQSHPATLLLGIEAGGTRTVVAAVNGSAPTRTSEACRRMEFGPANLRLLSDTQLSRRFAEIPRALPQPASLAIGMAGAPPQSRPQPIPAGAAPPRPC